MVAALWFAGASPGHVQAAHLDYVVRRGDTLFTLAERYLNRPADYREVARLNGVRDPRRLRTGRTLRLPLPLLRSTPAQARIVNARGPVTVDLGRGPVAGAAGQTLSEGALIVTGANAFVRVALPDGGHIALPSRSRVRIERLRTVVLNGATDQRFALEGGRVESSASPVRPAGRFAVGTPISVSAVRGTSFRNSFDPSSARAGTEVLEGSVAVAAGGAELVADPAQGVSAGAEGVRLASLLPAPELLRPDAIQSGEALGFEVAPTPGAVRYRIRIATDAGMVDAFAETDSAPGTARLSLPGIEDGLYFARVSAVSADGLEGLATVYSFVRARSGVGGLAASGVGRGRDRRYLFRWEPEGEGPARYRFQLTPAGGAVPVVDEFGLDAPRFTLSGVAPGTYDWRVRITRVQFGRVIETWSDPQTLRIGRE